MAKQTPREIAEKVVSLVREYGADLTIRSSIASVTMRFPAGSPEAFGLAECLADEILSIIPRTSPGSSWGTDGIAAMVAINSGRFTMNKSGCSKRVLAAIQKVL